MAPASPPRAFNGWDLLKVLAIVSMVIDHVAAYLYTTEESIYWLRSIGRLAAPIFLFLTGYAKRYHFSKELCMLAFTLAAFDWIYFWHINTLNILWTILICRLIFNHFEKQGKIIQKPHEWFIGGLSLIALSTLFEYGSFGFLMAFSGYLLRHREHYTTKQVEIIAVLGFLVYWVWELTMPDPPVEPILTTLAIMGGYYLCRVLPDKKLNFPGWLVAVLKPLARYSGYLYVGHLIVFMIISGTSG